MVTFSPYPFDSRPRRALDAFVSEGASVDLICLGSRNAPWHETHRSFRVLRIPLKQDRRGKIGYVYRYAAFIFVSTLVFALRTLARRYDLVYVHNMPDILVVSGLIPKAFGAKIVLDQHDPMPELWTTIFGSAANGKSVNLLKRLEKWSMARADLVITVNLACQRIFSRRSCTLDKILIVMNAPDSSIFPFHEPREHRGTEKAATKPFVLMYHGTMVERNGLDLAIEALALARDKMPTAELRIYGPRTSFLDQVMETVQARGMQDIVHYCGPRRVEDLVSEIEACDVGVIPNRRNAFTDINTPARIFDYLIIGKPAIAPSTPGIKDYFPDDSLVFFESGNAMDLAKQMEYAYSHRDEVFEIARKGQEIYLKHTWEHERETLLDGVNKIIN